MIQYSLAFIESHITPEFSSHARAFKVGLPSIGTFSIKILYLLIRSWGSVKQVLYDE